MSRGKILFLSLILVIVIGLVAVVGTYAYFSASTNTNNNIEGSTYDIDYDVSASVIYGATDLIPIEASLIDTAVSKSNNKCQDNDGVDVCSLYQVVLTNNSASAINLAGFIRTNASTYTSTNLKYKVYDSSYNPISDALSVSNTASESVYFKQNGSNVNLSLASSATYYISLFIEETENAQDEDQNKTFNFKIGFEGTMGSKLSASFNLQEA